MSKKKVLIVTQEMKPYTALSEISEIARKLPQYVQENGMEIRILMPRFGTINERRHRLHEVVRLSGMNIICLLYTSPSPRDLSTSRMPSSA